MVDSGISHWVAGIDPILFFFLTTRRVDELWSSNFVRPPDGSDRGASWSSD
jgi:hypothetical protein